jgi:DNA-binding PadR family transcriptional regulator
MPAMTPLADPTLPPHWFQILLALADSERHGLAIMEDVLDRTGGQMRLWPGMLYRNLRQLEADGLIGEVRRTGPVERGSPRYFHITPAGRRACAAEARRLESFVEAARAKKLLRRT